MEVSTPLAFRGFVYYDARFSPDKKIIEVAVRPRKGCGLSVRAVIRRRRVTINSPNGGLSSFPCCGGFVFLLYTMRVDCRRCGVVAVEEVPWGDGKRTLTKA